MRKTIFGLLALLSLLASGLSYAQLSKDQNNNRKELAKASNKELNEKASKVARKEAKKLTKEGWKTAPGALPIEKQLDNSYMLQFQYDDDGYPKFIMAEAMSTGGNYDAAKLQALELAKQNLAAQIQSEITALIENTVSNEQIEQSDAVTITRSVMSSKNVIAQSIGRIIPVVEIYRVVNGNNREVLVRIAYSYDTAKAVAKDAIKKDLDQKGVAISDKLNKILGW